MLIMCMDKLHLDSQQCQPDATKPMSEESPPDITQCGMSSAENSYTSCDDADTIEFGPIKVKPRKKPAPTLATGRRSKYETLTPEEEQKRELRRARNRAAAERVRLSRLGVEQKLQEQIDVLEGEEKQLSDSIQMLGNHKLQLQARLITHENICSTGTSYQTGGDSLNSTPTPGTLPPAQAASEFNFDELFPPPSTPLPAQPDHLSNWLTTITPNADFDDIWMDP